ncbi:sugar dehydrogenase complex small subunit [Caballeronia sp. LZ033]|uniref:sugar dehydrogenase complex small subunit n=1 Tax=Caballeronia sp. LZ033 TaxID=3038566 RepID=UPI00286652B2|nr:sugar dehydrogenase complex small subunit [Caballeronia sp. LZ033]
MNQPSVSMQRGPVRARTRRTLLAGIVASCVTTWVPGTTRRPMPAELATALPAPESFVALSKFLTGQASLDLALADRLFIAGTGVMPTAATVNSTLTAVALALRTAEHLHATSTT